MAAKNLPAEALYATDVADVAGDTAPPGSVSGSNVHVAPASLEVYRPRCVLVVISPSSNPTEDVAIAATTLLVCDVLKATRAVPRPARDRVPSEPPLAVIIGVQEAPASVERSKPRP